VNTILIESEDRHEIIVQGSPCHEAQAPGSRGDAPRRGSKGRERTRAENDWRLKDNQPVHQGFREKCAGDLSTAFHEQGKDLAVAEPAERVSERRREVELDPCEVASGWRRSTANHRNEHRNLACGASEPRIRRKMSGPRKDHTPGRDARATHSAHGELRVVGTHRSHAHADGVVTGTKDVDLTARRLAREPPGPAIAIGKRGVERDG
jgi:hypothetical protein